MVEGTSPKLLLVDDDSTVCDAVASLLKTMGYDVVVADTGPRAIEILKANPDGFGWAIVDVAMPGMGGIETVGHLRDVQPDLAVVIATGFTVNEISTGLMKQDRTAMVQKPYRGAAIKSLLDSFAEA